MNFIRRVVSGICFAVGFACAGFVYGFALGFTNTEEKGEQSNDW